jgi:hypothetical protein
MKEGQILLAVLCDKLTPLESQEGKLMVSYLSSLIALETSKKTAS